MKRIIKIVTCLAFAGLLLAGCGSSTPSSVVNDQNASNANLQALQKNQPIPQDSWSQFRQTTIDVEQAQIHGVATTTFFFNAGVQNPFQVCPSIGFAVASTSQLTNPEQLVNGGSSNYYYSGVVGQVEPNGVYTGASSGTYVVCVSANGTKYIDYWEGNVHTVGGAAHWDKTQGMIVLDGDPTVVANTKK